MAFDAGSNPRDDRKSAALIWGSQQFGSTSLATTSVPPGWGVAL